jgi:hypothetical protein
MLVQEGGPEAPEQRDGIGDSEVAVSETAGSMPDGWRWGTTAASSAGGWARSSSSSSVSTAGPG